MKVKAYNITTPEPAQPPTYRSHFLPRFYYGRMQYGGSTTKPPTYPFYISILIWNYYIMFIFTK